MNQAFHLHRLQQIDTQISQNETTLAELNQLLSGDEAVRQAEQAAESAAKALRAAQQKLKQAESSVKDQQIKIAQSESTLYGGKVRNPKELQDLQKEIASLKTRLGVLEDHQLEAMLALEEAEAADAASQKALAQARATFAERSAGWLGQKEQLLRLKERLESERAAALGPVDQQSLQIYENLRRRKFGVAVTSVTDGSCGVCGAGLRPGEIQAARASQNLSYCSNCGRILYTG